MTHLLLACFVLFFGAAFVWPTLRLRRRDRVNALVPPSDDTAHGLIASWFRGPIAALFALLFALAVGLPAEALGPLGWLEGSATLVTGWALLLGSLVWIVVAQAQMGRSWRIGIDGATRPPLVRQGLFGRSRNPIFLGLRVSFAGLLLALPNAATLAVFLLGEALIQMQVRLEEAYLSIAFGDDYANYRRAVPRWFGTARSLDAG